MENFNVFIDYIARTNLFNFVIFLSIIILLIKKIDVNSILKGMQTTVEDSIKDSEEAKVESEKRLSTIEESISHIEEDIDNILAQASKNAKLVGDKLLQDAEKTALIIQDNSEKALENSRVLLKNELIKRASMASIEVAKKHIIDELSWNQGLHEKLIDESIDAIGGVEF